MRQFSRRKFSTDPVIRGAAAGDAWHHDIAAYLGGMNTALAGLALLRLYAIVYKSKQFSATSKEGDDTVDRTALLVLAIGNFSQAFLNFWNGLRTARWIMGKGFDPITVFDVVFTVLDLLAFSRRLL